MFVLNKDYNIKTIHDDHYRAFCEKVHVKRKEQNEA